MPLPGSDEWNSLTKARGFSEGENRSCTLQVSLPLWQPGIAKRAWSLRATQTRVHSLAGWSQASHLTREPVFLYNVAK